MSIVSSRVVASTLEFPAASVLVTETSFVPFTFGANVPIVGVSVSVLITQFPDVSAVVV